MRDREPKSLQEACAEVQRAFDEIAMTLGEALLPWVKPLIRTPLRWLPTLFTLLVIVSLLGYVDSGISGALGTLGIGVVTYFFVRTIIRKQVH